MCSTTAKPSKHRREPAYTKLYTYTELPSLTVYTFVSRFWGFKLQVSQLDLQKPQIIQENDFIVQILHLLMHRI
jgi:hypothetical protein